MNIDLSRGESKYTENLFPTERTLVVVVHVKKFYVKYSMLVTNEVFHASST
jgi:hypothetical protein